jgi:hypothetical protein
VSQPTTVAATTPRSTAKKYGPLTRNQWIGVGVVFAAVLGYMLWKKHQAASSGSSSSSTAQPTAATATDTGCYDPSGNPIPCADAALLDQLAGQEGSTGAGGGSSGGGTTTATAPTTGTTTATSTGTTASTGTTTANGSSGGWSYPAPTGLKNTAPVGPKQTQLKLSWNPVVGPQGQKPATYTVRIDRSGANIRENTVAGTSYTENGLTKGNNGLNVTVWANGGPVAPPHASLNT